MFFLKVGEASKIDIDADLSNSAMLKVLQFMSRAVASPRAGGEHEKIFTPKKGFFGIVPPLCPP